VALDEGVQARDGAEDGAPGSGALFVGVESGAVTLLRAAALGGAEVQARLVVLGANAAFGLAIVAGLVVYMAEVAAKTVSKRAGRKAGAATYALDAFFLLRGLAGGSLPASAPVSLGGGGGPGAVFPGDGAGGCCESEI
jgi:hypothetical protein